MRKTNETPLPWMGAEGTDSGMAQVVTHVCSGFVRGRGGVCMNCGHPKEKHVGGSINGAGSCKECVRLWVRSQREAARWKRLL